MHQNPKSFDLLARLLTVAVFDQLSIQTHLWSMKFQDNGGRGKKNLHLEDYVHINGWVVMIRMI